MMPYMSLCVVMIDLGNLRDQIFPRTGFAPSAASEPDASEPAQPHTWATLQVGVFRCSVRQ